METGRCRCGFLHYEYDTDVSEPEYGLRKQRHGRNSGCGKDEGTTREVEMYNYEKFFDAIHAANTDGADKDNTAGGDKGTSFKPFRWIRENVFGYRDGYEKYPADNNGVINEVTANTSKGLRGPECRLL